MEQKFNKKEIFESSTATVDDLKLCIDEAISNYDSNTGTIEADAETVVSVWNLLNDKDKNHTKPVVEMFMDLEMPEGLRTVDTKETIEAIKKASLF